MSSLEKELQDKITKAKTATKRRTRKGGKLRKAGSHWYELEAYFDERENQIIKVNDSGFMRGVLEDFVVVEVPREKSMSDISRIGALLARNGVKALVVQEGIRMLRLKEISGERVAELDAIMEKQKAEEQVNDKDTPDDVTRE